MIAMSLLFHSGSLRTPLDGRLVPVEGAEVFAISA
jgi:hypothetical protein